MFMSEPSTSPAMPMVVADPFVWFNIHCFCFSEDIPIFLAINSLRSFAIILIRWVISVRSSDIPLACHDSIPMIVPVPSRKINTQIPPANIRLIPLFSSQRESGTNNMAKRELIANGIRKFCAK